MARSDSRWIRRGSPPPSASSDKHTETSLPAVITCGRLSATAVGPRRVGSMLGSPRPRAARWSADSTIAVLLLTVVSHAAYGATLVELGISAPNGAPTVIAIPEDGRAPLLLSKEGNEP